MSLSLLPVSGTSIRRCDRASQKDAGDWIRIQRSATLLLGLLLSCRKGDTAGAIAELQKTKTPDRRCVVSRIPRLRLCHLWRSSESRADRCANSKRLAKRQYVSSTAFATIHLGTWRKGEMLWIGWKNLIEQQDSACWYLKIDQIYDQRAQRAALPGAGAESFWRKTVKIDNGTGGSRETSMGKPGGGLTSGDASQSTSSPS